MKFSVLMTTYYKETETNLRRSLDSILFEQSVIPNQMVLVFDGPVPQALVQVAEQAKEKFSNEMIILQLPENVGQSGASLAGIQLCTCPLLARMDSDDVSEPDRFEKELRVFEEHPEVDVVGGWIGEFTDDENTIYQLRKVPRTDSEIKRGLRFRNTVNNVSIMMKREKVLKAGGYTQRSANEDYSLYVQMCIDGAIFYNIPEVLVRVRIGNGMTSRRRDMNIFYDWVKDQRKMLASGNTTVLHFCVSIAGCFGFVVMPNSLKSILYRLFLRRKT